MPFLLSNAFVDLTQDSFRDIQGAPNLMLVLRHLSWLI
jgi:hypothetical protein